MWDPDGNEYIDYISALGPNLLGYNYPDVNDAVEKQLEDGAMFSMEHPLQVEVAEQFTDVIPNAEMVKFAKSGNDVTTLAARLARAHTDRDVIATYGYHGWPDVWMSNSNTSRGIPDEIGKYTEGFEYNDIESVERIFEKHPGNVAAIVTVPVNLQPPEDDFLEQLREIADREGALLVFDEVLTGFRFSLGGAQEYFGVDADLACFAKAMANGYPISALTGRRDIMQTLDDDDVFFTMTYAGEALSLAATKASIEVQQQEEVPAHIFKQGQKLIDGFVDHANAAGLEDVTNVEGYPTRFKTQILDENGDEDKPVKSLFMQECVKRGVLYSGGHIPMFSHSDEDLERTLEVYRDVLDIVADARKNDDVLDRLDGPIVGTSHRERSGQA